MSTHERTATLPARPTSRLTTLVLALGLAASPAVALGFARFAYGLLLPGMRADLSWTYTQAGLMNTANAGGYLAGALVAGGPIGLPLGLVASGLLFGGCFLAVPAAVTAVVHRSTPPARWTGAIGALTIGFAAGQCIGPLMAGFVSDRPGGLVLGLALSAAALAVGAALSLAHRERSVPSAATG